MKILVTGGSGFIGSAFIRKAVNELDYEIYNVDKITYASNEESLKDIYSSSNYHFKKKDINDTKEIEYIFKNFQPNALVHFAAESHVDNSISSPEVFLHTNIIGTFSLLKESLKYWNNLDKKEKNKFKFLHVSTDEVYGELTTNEEPFTEKTPYAPNSPYSASKASSDHLVRAWFETFKLPTVITHCSNNYGPFQNPEKFIPKIITNIIQNETIPVYGSGQNIRDWLYVEDHVSALFELLTNNVCIGEKFNIGGNNEIKNLEIVNMVFDIFEKNNFKLKNQNPRDLITYVDDRLGHDFRYAIDSSKIKQVIGWNAQRDFKKGLESTVEWYLDNKWWWEPLRK